MDIPGHHYLMAVLTGQDGYDLGGRRVDSHSQTRGINLCSRVAEVLPAGCLANIHRLP